MSKLRDNGSSRHTPTALNAASEARIARANRAATDLSPVIAELRAAGITSLKGIAKALDERRVPTPWGSSHWHPMQVSRVLKRLAERDQS
jgi:hypothetical protein